MDLAVLPTSASATALHVLPQSASRAQGLADFERILDAGLSNLNAQLVDAERGVQSLALGTAQSVHGVMLQLEQARLAMQIALQVRTRLVEAYQDVIRMQV